jgi:hypothetical protein
MCCFNPAQVRTVRDAGQQAAGLVSDYYCVAPREWRLMPYEVKTLRRLNRLEVTHHALAQTLCYSVRQTSDSLVLKEGDLYRICLQDHRILDAARHNPLSLRSLLTYVLTHELIHVVRFGQRLQRVDLPADLRLEEERKVEKTTRTILAKAGPVELRHFVANAASLVC